VGYGPGEALFSAWPSRNDQACACAPWPTCSP